MTDHRTDDRTCVFSLLEQAGVECIDEHLADTNYDGHGIYYSLEDHKTSNFLFLLLCMLLYHQKMILRAL